MLIDEKLALKRLRRGDVIHREVSEGVTRWWFETPYAEVSPEAGPGLVAKLGKKYVVKPQGDGLFGTETSQTWRAEKVQPQQGGR
jgi:hypothetical protein